MEIINFYSFEVFKEDKKFHHHRKKSKISPKKPYLTLANFSNFYH